MPKVYGVNLSLNNKLLIHVRSFKAGDRRMVRKLCADTAFMGEPVERFFSDRELFADWATAYYTDYEPESIFLAEYDKTVIGYIMGCKDEKRYNTFFSKEIFPRLWVRSIGALWGKPRHREFLFCLGKSFLRGEFNRPDFAREYPAHLHINVDMHFREQGIGSRLIHRFLEHLISSYVRAVRLATISKRAYSFFEKSGFGMLYEKQVTYFSHILKDDLYLRIYGKTLERNELALT